jgi:hypothetical protein
MVSRLSLTAFEVGETKIAGNCSLAQRCKLEEATKIDGAFRMISRLTILCCGLFGG